MLTFRALSNDSVIFVRGTYFRIFADGTLRGPDNAVAARYADGLWHVARNNTEYSSAARLTNLLAQTPQRNHSGRSASRGA